MADKWHSHGVSITSCEIEFYASVSNANSRAHTESNIPRETRADIYLPLGREEEINMVALEARDLTQREEKKKRGRKEVNDSDWPVSQ